VRLHRLEFQAIGPFPGRHVVDLDAVGASGLFLLEGPTGAGKSTIIDAIVFALYGDIADSTGAHKSRMHSMHAEPGVEPYVDLTFSSSRGIYRVRRTPAHERPKMRGEGTTTVKTRASLTRLSGEDQVGLEEPAGEAVSSSTQEIGTEIGTILGMSRDQFTQTVVLPQGQFARFLRAGVAERQDVLRTIFGTRLYDDVEAELHEMAAAARKAAERAVGLVAEHAGLTDEPDDPGEAGADDEAETGTEDEAHAEAATDSDAVTGAGSDSEAQDADAPADPVIVSRGELLDAATAVDAERVARLTGPLLAAIESDASRAEHARADAAERESEARSRLQSEQRTADLLARRTTLLAEREDLDARADAVAADREALERHGRAREVVTALLAASRRATEAAQASAAVAELVDQAADTDPAFAADLDIPRWQEPGDRPALAADLDAAREEASSRAGTLSEVVALEAGLAAREQASTDAAARIDERELALATARAEADELPRLRESLVEERTAQATIAGTLAAAQVAATRADESVAAARAAATAETAAREADRALSAAHELATERANDESALRARWREEVAGRLATGLAADDPCPVCGSTSHPAPAPPSDSPVTDQDLEAAEEARARADRALSAAREAKAAAHQRLELAREASGGLDVVAAEEAQKAARAEVDAAQAAATRLATLDEALADHDRAAREKAESIARSEASLATDRALHASEADRLRADTERVTAARGTHATVGERADQIGRRSRLASGVVGALRTLVERDRTAQQAATEADDALEASGFDSADEARAASLEPGAEAVAKERVRAHEAGSARVAAGLAEEAIAALTGEERPDVAAATAALEAAVADLTARTGEERLATSRRDRARAAADALREEIERHHARLEADRALRRVAELSQGGAASRTGTRLSTYVLLRRFEDVLSASNERLAAMSTGRYRLERTDEKEAGQRTRATGLGLKVLDTFADGARDPRTLSGGETFYVALALALGLADVVTAEAGGIELGTLFVDEGFGSLDPDTLDAVMTELGRLRTGGRCVGLISHVTELKQRIADRIEVRHLPSGAGSSLRVSAGR
jgi:exonuclease SbcC